MKNLISFEIFIFITQSVINVYKHLLFLQTDFLSLYLLLSPTYSSQLIFRYINRCINRYTELYIITICINVSISSIYFFKL